MSRALAAALLLALPAAATEIHIGAIDSGPSARPRWALGLGPFTPKDPHGREDAEAGRLLREVVRADLLFSRYFDLLEQAPAAGAGSESAAREAWRARGAQFLVEAEAERAADQTGLTVRVRDLASGDALLSRYYRQKSELWRAVAHRVADDIVRQLTGRPGIAQSKIAFVSDAGGSKQLQLVDYDGARARALTRNGAINLLPRLSPDGRRVAFTSYKDGNPDIFLLDLDSGDLRTLSDRQGLNLAGGFSPDGALLAATLSRGKDPNIHLVALRDGKLTQVSHQSGVESSPTFSPDGQHLAFVSDRAGNPQIHTVELATGRTRRLTQLNWCDAPAWSPTGEWIAFSGRANRKDAFDIFLVDPAGTRVVQLTHGEGSNEDPAWSPDGRFLVFTSTRSQRRRLFVMDADGSAPRPLADLPGRAFSPSWGS